MTLLNDFHTDVSKTCAERASSAFSPFPRLPAELASLISKQDLRQTRLIRITVSEKKSDDVQLNTTNRLGRVISGRDYRLQVTTHHVISPLLQTDRESRRAALEFYRIHIPYDRMGEGEQQCLYIHPELDFILIEDCHPSEILADFIHDLKAFDPRGTGILNLGIDCRGRKFKFALSIGECTKMVH